MTNRNSVLVIGTGTIGEPLIGLLARFKKELGIETLRFHKKTPLIEEIPKVNSLINNGAELVVDEHLINQFFDLGHDVSFTLGCAIDEADIIIDCTPVGNENKVLYYSETALHQSNKIFIAQGSEKGFGTPYALGINDEAVFSQPLSGKCKYIQVVSCNTHNISVLMKALADNVTSDIYGDFVCIRRSSDMSQLGGFVASPMVDPHQNSCGTHHAKDALDLFDTINIEQELDIFSSSMKINNQLMHTIRFSIDTGDNKLNHSDVLSIMRKNKYIGLTNKMDSARVFSYGRDHGFYGRIFNQAIVVEPSLSVADGVVNGFCFTPQDGNSLLSTVSLVNYFINGEDSYDEIMDLFSFCLFDYV